MIYQNISNMKYRILLASLVLLTACAEKSQNDLIEQKVDDMLSQMTLEEIGEEFGLTRERVRQIKEKAIRRLRHSSRSKLLKSYLG